MALIDRETISIPLYVFIISRLSRRFNIETSTWDECRYIGGWIGPSGVAGRIPLYPFSCWTARGGGGWRAWKEDETNQRFPACAGLGKGKTDEVYVRWG